MNLKTKILIIVNHIIKKMMIFKKNKKINIYQKINKFKQKFKNQEKQIKPNLKKRNNKIKKKRKSLII